MYLSLPLEVLDQISRHCPRALSTYVLCLSHANADDKCVFSKGDIQMDMHESFTMFRNNLKLLSREGLLEWHYIDDKIFVTLAAFNQDGE